MNGIVALLCGVLLFLSGGAATWSAEREAKGVRAAEKRAKGAKSGEKQTEASKKRGMGDLFADDNEPIVITSDRMELDRRKNTVTYRGNVLTVRGDLQMRSDSLSGIIDFEGKGLKTIVAAGNVHVTQEGRTATGDEAVFDSEKETITLVGNPVIQQGNSKISGDRVIVYLKEDRGVVEGGTQRVRAVIFPGELGDNKKKTNDKKKTNEKKKEDPGSN